jgi:hypothetical protein
MWYRHSLSVPAFIAILIEHRPVPHKSDGFQTDAKTGWATTPEMKSRLLLSRHEIVAFGALGGQADRAARLARRT